MSTPDTIPFSAWTEQWIRNNYFAKDVFMAIFNRMRGAVSDDVIIDLFWTRNEKAIEEMDLKYRRYLFAIAYNILSSREDSEECLNDTYMGAWETIPPERPLNLKAFLTKILRHYAINRYNESRRQKRVPSNLTYSLDDLSYALADDAIIDEADNEQLGRIISDYLRTLTKRQRYIFMSRYYTAEAIEKIADDLSISKSMVNKEIALIKSGLKSTLEKEGYGI